MAAKLTTKGASLRDQFMAWQCLIRQHAMRRDGGRPSDGMEPLVLMPDGQDLGHIRTVIAEREPEETTAMLRHAVQRTNDPRERFDKGLRYLSSGYFQKSRNFEPRLLVMFGPDSPGARSLLDAGTCSLEFGQFNQNYRLPCVVQELERSGPFAEALYWHNALFNPALPPDSRRLAFAPSWNAGEAY